MELIPIESSYEYMGVSHQIPTQLTFQFIIIADVCRSYCCYRVRHAASQTSQADRFYNNRKRQADRDSVWTFSCRDFTVLMDLPIHHCRQAACQILGLRFEWWIVNRFARILNIRFTWITKIVFFELFELIRITIFVCENSWIMIRIFMNIQWIKTKKNPRFSFFVLLLR